MNTVMYVDGSDGVLPPGGEGGVVGVACVFNPPPILFLGDANHGGAAP